MVEVIIKAPIVGLWGEGQRILGQFRVQGPPGADKNLTTYNPPASNR